MRWEQRTCKDCSFHWNMKPLFLKRINGKPRIKLNKKCPTCSLNSFIRVNSPSIGRNWQYFDIYWCSRCSDYFVEPTKKVYEIGR